MCIRDSDALDVPIVEPPARRALAVAWNEDLCDPVQAGEVHHRFGEVAALEHPGLDLEATGEVEVALQPLTFIVRQMVEVRCLRHIDGKAIRAEIVSDTPPPADHGGAGRI